MPVDKSKCISCGACVSICPVNAIRFGEDGKAEIDETKCIRCDSCEATCPVNAIKINY